MSNFVWGRYSLPFLDETDDNAAVDLGAVEQKVPLNLRLATEPYPHLRDDDGCVLARDYIQIEKLAFILRAVQAYEPD